MKFFYLQEGNMIMEGIYQFLLFLFPYMLYGQNQPDDYFCTGMLSLALIDEGLGSQSFYDIRIIYV